MTLSLRVNLQRDNQLPKWEICQEVHSSSSVPRSASTRAYHKWFILIHGETDHWPRTRKAQVGARSTQRANYFRQRRMETEASLRMFNLVPAANTLQPPVSRASVMTGAGLTVNHRQVSIRTKNKPRKVKFCGNLKRKFLQMLLLWKRKQRIIAVL